MRAVLAAAVALVACPFLTGSSQAAPADVVPGSDATALALLRSAVRAESTLTYGGVEDVVGEDPADDDATSGGGTGGGAGASDVVAVSHVAGEGTVLMVRGTTTGTRAGFLGADARRPDLLVDLLQRSYRVVLAGTATVAGAADPRRRRPGRERGRCGAVLGRRRDRPAPAPRPGGRHRTDDGVAGVPGGVADRSPGRVPAAAAAVRLDRRPGPAPARRLPGAGVAGQRPRRRHDPLRRAQDESSRAPSGDVLHLSYSDGLSTVSVFVQQGRLDGADLPGGHARDGGRPAGARGRRAPAPAAVGRRRVRADGGRRRRPRPGHRAWSASSRTRSPRRPGGAGWSGGCPAWSPG